MKFSRLIVTFLIVVAAVIALILVLRSSGNKDSPDNQGAQNVAPAVNFITTESNDTPTRLVLPAALQAFQDTPIYARTTGYIAKWFFDIGDHVKAGDTLATIEGPDLDQELNQAKAALGQTEANLNLAKISAERWKALGEQHAVAQQDVDTKVADYEARQADTKAAQANVDRLVNLKAYQNVAAPYDGVISARNAQVGELINPGAGAEIYHIAQIDPLRVYVNVPQSYVRSIHPGLEVEVRVPEFENHPFKGKLVRTAGSLDPTSRTLLVELELSNPNNELFPGMFCEVYFQLTAAHPAILIPSNAMMVRADGAIVMTIDQTNHLHLLHVRLGRDFGTEIEILEGLMAGERIVSNPSDSLTDGLEVQPRDQKSEDQKRKQESQEQSKKGQQRNPKNGDTKKEKT